MTAVKGIRTLEDLRIRCVVSATTGCWLYPSSISDDGLPRCAIPPHVDGITTDKWITTTVRKAGWLLEGNRLRKGQRMYAGCPERECCNPDHTLCSSQKVMAKKFVRRGLLQLITSRRNTAVQAATVHEVAEVTRLVAAGLTQREAAVLVGLHPATVGKIVAGRQQHQRPLAASSVFEQVAA